MLRTSLILGLALLGATTSVRRADAQRPNIVFIMADDLGNADLGYRGGEIKSPNIDKLAKEGVRLESFYGEPVCTPSRAALMTGRYPMRYGLQTLVIFPSHTYGLATDERTLPQALKEAGYTTLMDGKWHLGHADKKFWPQNRGFDYFYGNVVGEVNYFTRERGGLIDWQRNGTFLRENGYYTNLIGDDAVKLIDRQDGSKPFFLYFASLAPHAPYQAPESDIDQYKSVPDKLRRTYSAMITALDDQVGRIVAELNKKGLRDNTIILFASDNGGATSGLFASGSKSKEERDTEEGGIEQGAMAPASNAPFRGGKGSLYEGGVRVPAFINWPARLKPRVVNEPLHMVDVMPTLLALAGGKSNRRPSLRRQGHVEHNRGRRPLAKRGCPDQCRGLSRRHPQRQLEASENRATARQDRAVRFGRGPGRDHQCRRAEPRDCARPRGASPGLCQTAEAELMDQGPTGIRGQPGKDCHGSGLRHRRWWIAA